MLTQVDYANLTNIVARGTYNGIQEAAAAVALYQKVQTLAQTPDKVEDVGGNDSKNGT